MMGVVLLKGCACMQVPTGPEEDDAQETAGGEDEPPKSSQVHAKRIKKQKTAEQPEMVVTRVQSSSGASEAPSCSVACNLFIQAA